MLAVWTRFNSIMLVLVFLALVAIIAMLATGVRGGPLDPTGPPGSTSSSVQLPGTPIDAQTTINAPGHYYLTRNLTVAGSQTAITIAASNVSLDLGGFTIAGNDSIASWGIRTSGDLTTVTIKNGTVRDFQFGVDVPGLVNYSFVIEGVQAFSNVRGFSLAFSRGVLSDCTAVNNTETGIYVPGEHNVIRNCLAVGNDADGIAIAGCRNFAHWNKSTDNDLVDMNVIGCFSVVRDNHVGGIFLANSNNVAADNNCLLLTGAGGSNITAATSHQNIGC